MTTIERRKTTCDFANDIVLAKYAYTLAEKYIRASEDENDNNTNIYNTYDKKFDYWMVGKVLSMSANRKEHFGWYVTQATNKSQMNKRAYDWLCFNAVKENYTMWILECFKQAYITKDEDADCWNGFPHWIKSLKSDDGWTFFADTSTPLVVR